MNALHEQFVIEARELIAQATDDLIALERDGAAVARIERVFRAFHTLKGAAGVVELPAMSLVLHAAEDLLAAIHDGRLTASRAIIDAALACLDQVSNWVDGFEGKGALPSGAGEGARAMAERLRALLSDTPIAASKPTVSDADAAAVPDWAARLLDAARDQLARTSSKTPTALHAICYQPLPGCFFTGDDPLGLMRKLPGLLALQIEPREPWPELEVLDPFACNLRLMAIAATDRAVLDEVFRLVPDQVAFVSIAPDVLAQVEVGSAGQPEDLVRSILQEQAVVLSASPEGLLGRIGAVARVAANALRHGGRDEAADRIAAVGRAAVEQADPAPLQIAIANALASSATDQGGGTGAGDPETTGRSGNRSLRIDESRIDALVNLAGELTIAKNGFAHLAKQLESEIGDRALTDAIRRDVEGLDRLANEMRAAILQLRMVPVAQMFRTFPRLVRDISQRLGKQVSLVTEGEATEADKSIVDLLFEPLLHLVRNALDHGIELPEQRRAAGKPETATLTLRALRLGDRLIVEVHEDGRGIDPALVRARAGERGLLSADELATRSDEEIVDLVFAGGFSTASQLTDISGRGVGMDVVRNTIEQAGGRVSLSSRLGFGTQVRLDLPMSIAMLRIMVVEAGGQRFGIPMDAVSKTVRLTPDRIRRIKANEGFVLDDRVVPICSVAQLMHLPARPGAPQDVRLVVVAEGGGRIAGLEVDAIRDRLEVVLKPLQGMLAGASSFLGTTLMGDGTVLLVLDLKEVVP
uniref:Chemotaxis protein CheA n=1 Tax=Rhodopseudomonas palustris (strain BisA53) TaxID=316055 RepID=Q07KH3_RHOP5